jgi:hypothetical protein
MGWCKEEGCGTGFQVEKELGRNFLGRVTGLSVMIQA